MPPSLLLLASCGNLGMRLVMTAGSRNYSCNYSFKRPAVQPLLNGHFGQQRDSPLQSIEFNERFNIKFCDGNNLKQLLLNNIPFLIQNAR